MASVWVIADARVAVRHSAFLNRETQPEGHPKTPNFLRLQKWSVRRVPPPRDSIWKIDAWMFGHRRF
jgi:hypothetical protein